jgi:hypothetical protein
MGASDSRASRPTRVRYTRMWFALPDVIAAAILSPGKVPKVIRA